MIKLTEKLLEELRAKEERDKQAFEKDMEDIAEYQKRYSSLTDKQQKLYSFRLYPLALEFSFIYRLLLREKKIDLIESLKLSKKTKWYDVDIISILYLLKVIHTASNKTKKRIPVPDRKLIITWWFVLDEDYQKYYSKIWPKKLKDLILEHKKPYDYEQYLKDWELSKLKNNNSFHKYLGRAYNNWLKNKVILFLWTILSEIDDYIASEISPKRYIKVVLNTYETGFTNLVNDLDIWRRDMSSFDYIRSKYLVMWYKDCLNVIKSKYKNQFYERLWFR